ncbi:zincin-like metallopeptidase domain-containing protein [Acidocella aminolytica]|uniref:Antirestriction protein ArdC n=1 Tax=Acidocella aminolytica 101 = DSM 11237 TaxID=1120923 RepID=A0A0D6PGR4_9PROT|nr:zincin-like metallopeptidase domain-containing protein [Acidocella aminolytica]GAN80393.1 hypothetical protein Aam_046_034 [Acidocella aminolytica 101 = DSM 11237]GBQ34844.1 DNA primase TraC [Acidocella aminolytica 101 = DSM 11237]SHF44713.1 Antirestriction protein ArdC [Acidocella aminolytica 101 = DSM 11237]
MASNDYAQKVAAVLIEQLKQGTAPWIKPWQPGVDRSLPYNGSTGVPYKGANSLYLYAVGQLRGYGDNRWMTYVQAEKLGAQVRRGETSTQIQFWQWSSRVAMTDDAGQPLKNDKGEPLYQIIQHEKPLIRSANVFNAAQIDGLPPSEVRPVPPVEERHERAARLLEASQAIIREVSGDRAYYSLTTDEITIPDRRQFVAQDGTAALDGFFATALHELGHWTGHPDRLDRDIAHPFGSDAYAREELRAEIASLMLGEELGIGHDPGQHAAYVGSWIKALENDPQEIFRASTAAQNIMNYVLGFEKARDITTDEAVEAETTKPARSTARQPDLLEQQETEVANNKRRYLAVPYAEKSEARELGARWDKTAKAWWIGASVDPAPFSRWIEGASSITTAATADPQTAFADALRAAGLKLPGAPVMDGTIHRVAVDGDHGAQRSGAYVGYLDGRPAGVIQNFKTGAKINWKSDLDAPMDKDAAARLAAEAAQRRQERDQTIRAEQAEAANKAVAQLRDAQAVTEHEYLSRKGIDANGVKQDAIGRLMVPIADYEGKIASLQTIDADGTKGFMKGGKIAGGQFMIGDNDPTKPLYIAEGFATGATIHQMTGEAVSVAFNASNLLPVAEAAREKWPDRQIIIVGDNDEALTRKTFPDGRPMPNIGVDKAEAAGRAIGAPVVIPPAGPGGLSADWNDHRQTVGQDQAMRDFKERQAIAIIELRVDREIARENEMIALGQNPNDATRDATRDIVETEAQAVPTPRAEQEAERIEVEQEMD